MRLVTYIFRGTTRLGALVGDAEVVDLNRACALHRAERGERRARALADFLVPPDMLAFLQAGDPAMDAARATWPPPTPTRAWRDTWSATTCRSATGSSTRLPG